MAVQSKGGEFEREIAKRLSRWWTSNERDDVFWRTSQSGGRATQRRKFGKDTYGSQGDLAAVDPIGEPLLKLFTIELKRGSSIGFPTDLLDTAETDAQRPFEAAIEQAIVAHRHARSVSWLLITRRDRKIPMVWGDTDIFKDLHVALPPCVRLSLFVNRAGGRQARLVRFTGMPLEDFLGRITPQEIMKLNEQT